MGVSSYVFFSGMIDGVVRLELLADFPIDPAFVSSEMRFPRSDGNDERPDSLCRDVRDMK
jgi:hypothetical protein